MRRKPGGLVRLETAILGVALAFQTDGIEDGYQIAKHLADAANQRLLTDAPGSTRRPSTSTTRAQG